MGEYLGETIESVLANLRPGDEYFVIDGGSTDSSLEVIHRYQDRLSGWISATDRGYADALAKGFMRSSGKYQCWINCGDLLLSGALDQARSRLEQTGADMIFGDDLYIDEHGVVLQVTNGYEADLGAMMLYGAWTPLQDACYWRRSLYDAVGGIDSSLRFAADYDLFLRMSQRGDCRYIPVVFSAFRRHRGQTSIANFDGYESERNNCRRRELNRNRDDTIGTLLRGAYYWVKVRWRARVHARNPDMVHLVGKAVSRIPCQAIGSPGPA